MPSSDALMALSDVVARSAEIDCSAASAPPCRPRQGGLLGLTSATDVGGMGWPRRRCRGHRAPRVGLQPTAMVTLMHCPAAAVISAGPTRRAR